jgi:HSP20 family protein
MSLIRRDPFGEMLSLRRFMDSLFEDDFFRATAGQQSQGGGGMGVALDVMEKDDTVVVKASLPGVKPDDVDVSVQNNVLTIRGESRQEHESGEGRYHHRERRYGSFSRSVMLPASVDPNACDATFEDGVLTVTLQKSEQQRTRRIPIRGQQRPAIEGERGKAKESGSASNGGSTPASGSASSSGSKSGTTSSGSAGSASSTAQEAKVPGSTGAGSSRT